MNSQATAASPLRKRIDSLGLPWIKALLLEKSASLKLHFL